MAHFCINRCQTPIASAKEIIEYEDSRDSALAGLALQMAKLGFCQEAFNIARSIEGGEIRAEALTELALYIPESERPLVLTEVLAIVRRINDNFYRSNALARLIGQLPYLSSTALYPLWCETLHILARGARKDLLSQMPQLVATITTLDSNEVLDEMIQAVIDVSYWFP